MIGKIDYWISFGKSYPTESAGFETLRHFRLNKQIFFTFYYLFTTQAIRPIAATAPPVRRLAAGLNLPSKRSLILKTVYLFAMPQTSKYLQSLQDFELAFLKKYKLKTYLKPTQELILKEIFNRGLQDYELLNLIQEIEFNPANTGCPRCNSQKIRTDTVDISRGNRGGGFSIGVYFVIYQIDKIKHSEKFVVQH